MVDILCLIFRSYKYLKLSVRVNARAIFLVNLKFFKPNKFWRFQRGTYGLNRDDERLSRLNLGSETTMMEFKFIRS